VPSRHSALVVYYLLVSDPDSTPHRAALLDPEIARLVKLGRWTDVVRTLEAMIDATTEPALQAAFSLELGDVYLLRLGHGSFAIESYERALEIEPENGDALSRLESLYERRRDWKKLANVLGKIVEKEDDHERRKALGRKLALIRAVKLGEIDDVLVTLSHPCADGEVQLTTWIEVGPGPRSLVRPIAARSRRFGRSLPLSVVPFRYRNSWMSRLLVRAGVMRDPWAQ